MIPGIHACAAGLRSFVVASNQTELDLASHLGLPTDKAIMETVCVAPGVLINGDGALDCTSFHEDSILILINAGEIKGKGGDGTDGGVWSTGVYQYWEGAGGGGMGSPYGLGGEGLDPNGLDGADADAGGPGLAGTVTIIVSEYTPYQVPTDGSSGSHAIMLGCKTLIQNTNGYIFAGGGGGGVDHGPVPDPQYGGDWGEDGGGYAYHVSGIAVVLNGNDLTWLGGDDSDHLKGPVV